MSSVAHCDQCGNSLYGNQIEDGDKDFCNLECYLTWRGVYDGIDPEAVHDLADRIRHFVEMKRTL